MAEAGAGRRAQRYYDLDALRAVAMFLGIVLHTSVFLLPEMLPLWPIHDPAATGDPTYKLVIETIHGFRMPVFFLLSGFFSALLWQRRSLRALLTQRLRRVGIPLAVGCFTVVPHQRLDSGLRFRLSGTLRFPALDAALAMALRPWPISGFSGTCCCWPPVSGWRSGWACNSGILSAGGWSSRFQWPFPC